MYQKFRDDLQVSAGDEFHSTRMTVLERQFPSLVYETFFRICNVLYVSKK